MVRHEKQEGAPGNNKYAGSEIGFPEVSAKRNSGEATSPSLFFGSPIEGRYEEALLKCTRWVCGRGALGDRIGSDTSSYPYNFHVEVISFSRSMLV